jgi:fermentation-respiration switch protein FrsA (DUF1100 family)
MAGALTSVKEIVLPIYAERFMAAGFIALAFDYRYLGASEGEPRGQIFPGEQQEDIRNAITWISDQPEVDADRIGAWGVSLGGAHVIYLAAYDKRIKAVAATVPSMSTVDTILATMGPETLTQFFGFLTQDRVARYKTGAVNYMKAVASGAEPSLMRGPEPYEFYSHAGSTIAPNWRNQVTIESVEKLVEYDPAYPIHLISPTPLLMVVAEHDQSLPAKLSTAAFERAGEPKEISILPCGHTDTYDKEPWVSQSADSAIALFKRAMG